MKKTSYYLTVACALLVSAPIYAVKTYQQKIVLYTSVAHLNSAVPFTVDCPSCLEVKKENDKTYYITYVAPNNTTSNYMHFTYYYGDETAMCSYDANVKFTLFKDGRFDSSMNSPSHISPNNTLKACPPAVALFSNSDGAYITTVNIDW